MVKLVDTPALGAGRGNPVEVQVLSPAQEAKPKWGIPTEAYSVGGYGLVVKYVLAKDESGVRFSLPAQ